MAGKEIIIPIASLSFIIDTVEEVSLEKVFSGGEYDIPQEYSVSWNESIGDGSMVAEKKEQVYRVTKFQRFKDYEDARLFF